MPVLSQSFALLSETRLAQASSQSFMKLGSLGEYDHEEGNWSRASMLPRKRLTDNSRKDVACKVAVERLRDVFAL